MCTLLPGRSRTLYTYPRRLTPPTRLVRTPCTLRRLAVPRRARPHSAQARPPPSARGKDSPRPDPRRRRDLRCLGPGAEEPRSTGRARPTLSSAHGHCRGSEQPGRGLPSAPSPLRTAGLPEVGDLGTHRPPPLRPATDAGTGYRPRPLSGPSALCGFPGRVGGPRCGRGSVGGRAALPLGKSPATDRPLAQSRCALGGGPATVGAGRSEVNSNRPGRSGAGSS